MASPEAPSDSLLKKNETLVNAQDLVFLILVGDEQAENKNSIKELFSMI